MVTDAVGGADPERLTDLPQGRRDAPLVLVGGDELEQLTLTWGEVFHAAHLLNTSGAVKEFRWSTVQSAAPGLAAGAAYTVFHFPMPTLGIRFSTVLFTISPSTVAPPSISMSSSRPSAFDSLRRMRSGRR